MSSPTRRLASWGVIWPDSAAATCPWLSSEDAGGDSVDAMVVEGGLEERADVMSEWTASERKQLSSGAFGGMDRLPWGAEDALRSLQGWWGGLGKLLDKLELDLAVPRRDGGINWSVQGSAMRLH